MKKVVSKAIVDNKNKSIELIDTEGTRYFCGFEILDKAINRVKK